MSEPPNIDPIEFRAFPKIPRLSRKITVTEKIDGTNACVFIGEDGAFLVGSRQRWITPEADNFGFARWAHEHQAELMELGRGRHFGEWFGSGIQRGYGLAEKRFALFNVRRWCAHDAVPREFASADPQIQHKQTRAPACCHVVPVLYEGPFNTEQVALTLAMLKMKGSAAVPGFKNPEGVIIYHHAADVLFKKTLLGDEEGKHAEAHPPKPKAPRSPRDPSKGGRRIEQMPFDGADRRKGSA